MAKSKDKSKKNGTGKHFTQVYDAAQECGYGQYKASALAALSAFGPQTPSVISESAGIPKARIYDILDSLAKEGLIVSDGLSRKPTYALASGAALAKWQASKLSVLKQTTAGLLHALGRRD